MAKKGDNFQRNGYVPSLGDVVHLNWAPIVGREMDGPHYGLIISATEYNIGTGMVMAVPITSKSGKLSNFELPIHAGRLSGVAILSGLRSLDYTARDIQFETTANPALITEANRRIRMIFP